MTGQAKKQFEKISLETVKRVAEIARLDLSEAELKRAQADLNEILSAFKIIDEVDTKGVEPSFHPQPVENVVREDKIESPLGQEKSLAQTKHKHEGYFKGPRVV
ncbi:MAG: Asp-tRNA(Asn)/Glu-tRNA(Gln) amidotransferase subunit GatC [Candidatus Aenigmatarchaeota archaeon]